jgi:Putative abortive phage resistance protein AbiGi, antitoxin
MSLDIREVLNRRSDLSTFVVHLTRDLGPGQSAKENLTSIITSMVLRARTPYGWAAKAVIDHPKYPDLGTQRVVCFTETPLEHIYSQVAPIKNRKVKLEPYGLALTKMQARGKGINPVWYVDQTPGRKWVVSEALNRVRDAAIASGFHDSPAAQLFPFIEPMGKYGPGKTREFWWEREWRHVRDMFCPVKDVAMYLCPEAEIPEFEALIAQSALGYRPPPCIDPRWGLEQIIAHLAGLAPADISPFA